MIRSAFVEFEKRESAEKALSKLSRFKLLDKTLLVEFAKERDDGIIEKEAFPIARNLGINFPFPPYLEYKYPPPSKKSI